MRSLDIGATGMLAQQINVDVISNNIANMNTTGYKQQRAAFVDLFYENMTKPGSTSSDVGTIVPSGIQLGLGVKTGGIYRTHTQGSLQITENSLDLAVRGDGMFQISLPDGTTAYTRDGTFSRNENGQIVTKEGYELDPAITIPDDALSIDVNASGEVLVSTQGTSTQTNLGQIQLARFINESGAVQQGALETSNVNVVEELTRLISAQRAYEMNSKVITTSDEMLSTVSQMR
jgi:flagellar basal-body rod protein FlgG